MVSLGRALPSPSSSTAPSFTDSWESSTWSLQHLCFSPQSKNRRSLGGRLQGWATQGSGQAQVRLVEPTGQDLQKLEGVGASEGASAFSAPLRTEAGPQNPY